MERDDIVRRLTGPGAPFEIVEGQAGGRHHRVFRNGPASLRDLYEAARSDRPFIAFGDERLTFDEAWQRSATIATGLARTFGVGKGDRVAIAMRNNPEWILAFQAITSLGAIVVALNAHWTTEELVFGLTDSGARVLFADEQRAYGLEPALDRLGSLRIVVVRGPAPAGMLAYGAVFGAAQDAAPRKAAIEPDDDATILYTSGSTGRPKGVVSTHRNILTTLLSWELDSAVMAQGAPEANGSAPPDLASLLAVPLFHVTGLHAGYLGGLRAQRRLVIMPRWSAQDAARLIETHRITHLTAPAAITGDLVAVAAAGGHDLSSLLAVGGGGAARAPNQVREIDRVFPNAAPATGWGMTETNASGVSIYGAEYLGRPESSGRASHVMDLRIVDEAGAVLPPFAQGELQVRGASVMRGYWQRPDADAEAFDGDWFRTGDVAYIDGDGYLFIVDRLKDLVIRGGENIGCGLVEAALVEHPAVIEAVVYGVPDERLGERVAATIRAEAPVADEELKAFLVTRLARFQVPDFIRVVAEPLARTESGKIHRRLIRSQALLEHLAV